MIRAKIRGFGSTVHLCDTSNTEKTTYQTKCGIQFSGNNLQVIDSSVTCVRCLEHEYKTRVKYDEDTF
jgi:hypothetical protein